jgi:transposase
MDNAYWHKIAKTTSALKQLGLKALFNTPYMPQMNPIELVFAVIKHNFNKLHLQIIASIINELPQKLVRPAINQLDR